MSKQASIIGAGISIFVALMMFLVSFYVSAFAPKAEVNLKFSELESQMRASDIHNAVQLTQLKLDTDAKFDKILSNFCLIDKRTCAVRR